MIEVPKSRTPQVGPGFRLPTPASNGLAELGQAAFAVGTELRAQQDADQLSDRITRATQEISPRDIELEHDTDYSTVVARQAQAHDEIVGRHAASLPPHLQDRFRRQMAGITMPSQEKMVRHAFTMRREEGRAATRLFVDDILKGAANGDEAARATAAAQLLARLENEIEAGRFTPQEATEMERQFVVDIQTLDAARLHTDDPAALAARLEEGGFAALDPLDRQRLRASAIEAARIRKNRDEAELLDDIAQVELARALGSKHEKEAEIGSRASAAGMGDTFERARENGNLAGEASAMSIPRLEALIDQRRSQGIADKGDSDLLARLITFHEQEIERETREAIAAASEAARADEAAFREWEKQATKVVEENMTALSLDDAPNMLSSFPQARQYAVMLGRGEEFEAMYATYNRRRAPGVDPFATLPPEPRSVKSLAQLRARNQLTRQARAKQKLADSNLAEAIETYNPGTLRPIDWNDPTSLRRRETDILTIARTEYPALRRIKGRFTEAEREDFSAQWDSANADTRADLILGMHRTGVPRLAATMIAELGITNPVHKQAALNLAATGNRRLFLETYRGLERDDFLDANAPPTVVAAARASVFGNGLKHYAAQESAIIAMAQALYAARSGGADLIDRDAQTALFETALRDALGTEVLDLPTGRVVLPPGVAPDAAGNAIKRLSGLTSGESVGSRRDGVNEEANRLNPMPIEAVAAAGRGGVPLFGGAPVTPDTFEDARFVLAGDGLYEIHVVTTGGSTATLTSSEATDKPWLLDLRRLIEVTQ